MGNFDIENYNKYGVYIGCYYAVGSLKDSIYRSKHIVNNEKKYDICLISDSIIEYYSYTPILTNLKTLLLDVPNIKIAVAMKKDIDSPYYEAHRNIFIENLGGAVTVIPWSDSFSTYRLSDESKLTISSFSTSLRESLSRHNKIMCCNYTGFRSFSHNYPDEMLIENEGYKEFKTKVMNALNMPNDEYFKKHGGLTPYYNNYNDDKPTYVAINEIIQNLMVSK
jgi:hypothetical protein